MKKKILQMRYICLWIIMVVAILMTSCTSKVKPEVQSKVTAIRSTEAIRPTATMTFAPTVTAQPSLSTATLSPIKTPVPTFTPIFTIRVEQKTTQEASEQLLQELMQDNGNCLLPCWWGIVLGDSLESTEEKIIKRGAYFGRQPSDFGEFGEQGNVIMGYYNPNTSTFDVSTSVNFHTFDGNVQFIDVLAERPLHQYGQEEISRDWESYALNSVLQTYGKPQFVYLGEQVAEPGPPGYTVVIYYPDLGLNFVYHPYETYSNESQGELCLALDNMNSISLSLYNPDFVDVWSNYLLPPAINPEAEDYLEHWTWEEQTGMDLDTFYNIYKDTANPDCILIDR